ncbi:hypothetical protein Glove_99g167 [Diversispora epigaea]|uniref:Integrase zinc-binding domain-containing protein n=1 Tax=Diversispora epigaea TaxID=1348612 RepID=A0A397JE55_9GLOM|nr:hypothetical protein Glove_99g167 [Diversispora epigaea]
MSCYYLSHQDKEKVLYNLHSSLLAGHFEIKKIIEKAIERYYWFYIGKDIKEYIQSCDSCQKFGKLQKIQLIQSIPVVQPFYQIGIDYVDPLNPTPTSVIFI